MGRIQVYDSALKYVQTIGSSHWTNLAPAGASNSAFKNCTGVTADSSGRIYVSDSNNHRVQIFSALGQYQMTLGVTGLPGNDTGHFNYPRGLDVSPSGQLLVADGGIYDQFTVSSNQRVLVFKDIADAVADRTIGVVGFPGNDSVHLSQPWDVSINKDFKTAVADKGYITSLFPPKTYGQRVQIFNTTNDTAAGYTYGISGMVGIGTVNLNHPHGAGIGDNGDTYVADTFNHRVVVFKNDGNNAADVYLNPSGVMGSGPFQFNGPMDVDVDSKGIMYISDTGNQRIQLFDITGVNKGTLGETGVALSDAFHFNRPTGIKVGEDDKLYIADSGNNRIMKITPAGLNFGAVQEVLAPYNVSIDLGADVSPEWSRLGPLLSKTRAVLPADAVNALLAGLTAATDAYGNQMAQFTIAVNNAGHGRLVVSNLTIMYNCTVAVPGLASSVGGYVSAHAREAEGTGFVNVPIAYTAASAGGVRLGGLKLVVDVPPRLLAPIPDLALDEDTAAPALYNFTKYFQDDIDASLNFSLANLTNYTAASVTLVNGSVLSVDCTVASARNWNGAIEFRVKATDSRDFSTLSNLVTVAVRPVNDGPVITSIPPTFNARVGAEWSYSIGASDPDGEALTFILDVRPDGMTVNASSGRVAWTPATGDVGVAEVRLRASDGRLAAFQNFSLNVSPPDATNRKPVILSTPVTAAQTGKQYSYLVTARDDDNDRLSYSLDLSPAGMTVNNATGLVVWTPLASQEGQHDVVVRVTDGKDPVTQEFRVTVAAVIVDILPAINITSPVPGAKVHGAVLIQGTASAKGNATLATVEVSVDLDGRWVAVDGKSVWAYRLDTTKLSNGQHTVFIRARDSAGNYAQANLTLDVQNVAAPPPAENTLFGLPFMTAVILIVVVVAAIAAAGALAMVGQKRGRARPAAPPPLLSTGAPPPAVAAPAGAYTMTAPATYATAAPATYAAQPAAVTAVTPSSAFTTPPPAPGTQYPAPGPRHPVKAVDSVFLIYHDGRLITYFSKSESMKLDDTLDMIRKFVRASFSGQLGKLDSMRYENMNIIMERGNLMYMVVITPLMETDAVRREMRLVLEEINNMYRVVFKIWDGDFNKVKGVKTLIERFAGEEIAPSLQYGRAADSGQRAGAPTAPVPPSPPQSPLQTPPPYSPPVPPPQPSPITPPPQAQGQPGPAPPENRAQIAPVPPPTSIPPPEPASTAPSPQPQPPAPPSVAAPPPAKAETPKDNIEKKETDVDSALNARLDGRPPEPGKTGTFTSAPASPAHTPPSPPPSEPQPPAKARGLLEPEEDEYEEPAGETTGPEEPAPKIAPVVVNKEEPLPIPPPATPPLKTSAAPGLTDAERMRLLEDRFLRGEISELTYRELRDKLSKK